MITLESLNAQTVVEAASDIWVSRWHASIQLNSDRVIKFQDTLFQDLCQVPTLSSAKPLKEFLTTNCYIN